MLRCVIAGLAAVSMTAVALAATPDTPEAALTFKATDVHEAPYRNQPFSNGGQLENGNRYVWHQATIVDLIAAAYGVNADLVQGGPAWLERDRFEVVGLTDPKTPKKDLRLMLQSLLKDRFGLAMHEGEKAMPAYVLTVGKDPKTKMAMADEGGHEGCDFQEPPQGPERKNAPITLKCHSMTMTDFVMQVHDWGRGTGYPDKPVIDKTGLKDAYDFEFKWHSKSTYDRLGTQDGISPFDAVDKELGLKLTLETSPQKVWIVDNVTRKPTPNAADVAKLLPALPPAVFEVATVKPTAPGTKNGYARINNNQVNVQGVPLKFLMTFAWDLNPISDDDLVGAPKWLNEDKFDIMAKASSDGGDAQIDIEDLRSMVRDLLVERFQMKVHRDDRPIPAYTLYAAAPKMKKADPTERTKCFDGPGPDGKDPRKTEPVLNRLVTCQNMTSAEIAGELQHIAGGYIFGPVLDKSGLEGSYDFTLSFSSADKTNGLPAAKPDAGDASDPSGALTLYEAVSKQLGLKLVKEKRTMPVLVIDSIQEKPIED